MKPNNLPNIQVEFVSNAENIEAKELLQRRYSRAKAITGGQKYHCVIPNENETLTFKEFLSAGSRIYKMFKCARK